MQNRITGEMIPLDMERAKEEIKKEVGRNPVLLEQMQRACDIAQPDQTRQGPIFQRGEILILRGGRFRIDAIVKEGILLRGLPTKGLKS